MKAIAWTAVIVSFFIFAFVAFGYFAPAYDHYAREDVDASTDVCWSFFTKVHRMDEWIEGFKKVEIIKGLPNRPGSKFRVTLERNGEENVLTQTVLKFEKDEIFSFDMENEHIFGHTEITFDDSDGATHIQYRQVLKGKNAIYHAFLKLRESTLVDQQNRDLHRLRIMIESSK